MAIFQPQFNPDIISQGFQVLVNNPTTGNYKPQFGLENLGSNAITARTSIFNLKLYKPQVTKVAVDPDLQNWQDIIPDQMGKYPNGIYRMGTLVMRKQNDLGKDYTLINFNGVLYNSTDNPNPHPTLEDIYLDNVIMDIRQKKNVITTKILGRNGEIKEYVGLEDYDIKIEGVILGANGIYPREQVKMLINYLKLPASIFVTNPVLEELFGIRYITVDDYQIDEERGGISYQKFTISCVSDNLIDSSILYSPYGSQNK